MSVWLVILLKMPVQLRPFVAAYSSDSVCEASGPSTRCRLRRASRGFVGGVFARAAKVYMSEDETAAGGVALASGVTTVTRKMETAAVSAILSRHGRSRSKPSQRLMAFGIRHSVRV